MQIAKGSYPSQIAQPCAGVGQGCEKPLPTRIKVVGCGSCGVDYLASVAAYPRPDEKLRTEQLEVSTLRCAVPEGQASGCHVWGIGLAVLVPTDLRAAGPG